MRTQSTCRVGFVVHRQIVLCFTPVAPKSPAFWNCRNRRVKKECGMARIVTWRANSGDAWLGVALAPIFVAIGVIVLLYGSYYAITASQSHQWPSTKAKILSVEFHTRSRGGGEYTAIVYEFMADNGRTYQSRGSVDGRHDRSDTIEIKYNPRLPTWTVIDASGYNGIARVALIIGGGWTLVWMCVFASAVIQIIRRRVDNREFEARRDAKEARKAARPRLNRKRCGSP